MPTYYISPAGNDTTGDGSVALPWLTFTKAHTSSSNGDTITCATGTYTDATFFAHSKTLTWVTDGGVVTYNTTTTAHTLFINGSVDASFTGITFSGNDDTNAIVTADGSTGITFTDCIFTNSSSTTGNNVINGQGTVAGESDGWTFENCTLISNGASFFDLDAFNDVIINNCDLSGTYHFITVDTADTTGSVTFTNNTITGGTTDGRVALINSALITSATITGNSFTVDSVSGGTLIQVSIEDVPTVIVSNNTFDNRALTSAKAVVEISIDSPGGVTMDVTVDGNTIYDKSLTTTGIIVGKDSASAGDTTLNGAVISNNTLYQAGYYGETPTSRHGIELGFSTGTVRDNYVNGSFWSCVLKGGPAGVATDWTGAGGFYGNTSIGGDGVAMVNIKGVSSLPVANNIFINLGAETLSSGMLYIIENNSEIGSVPQNIDIKNNIFYQETGTVKGIYVEQATTVFTCDGNSYYSGTASLSNALVGRAGSPYTSSATWTAEGYDTTFISTDDPLFADLIDFELSSTSPLIGEGSKWWTGGNPVGRDGEPFADFGTDIGATQSKHNPFHPTKL